jgi:hypothetical protein
MLKKSLYSIGLTVMTLVFLFVFVMFQNYKIKDAVPVSLPSFSLNAEDVFWNKLGYVTAKGTWIITAPNEMGNPLRTSEIVCQKKELKCREGYASLFKFSSGTPFLNVTMESYPVLKWDDSQIIYADNAPSCTYYLYTINRITNEVGGVRMPKTNADEKLCQGVEKKNMNLRLVNGQDVVNAETSKVQNFTLNWIMLILGGLILIIGLLFIWKRKV